jgi:hypothetical protein
VAAGWYDGFFETGLSPWDIAAGSLMITEAGGLIGNFTGDADFLYQREVVAGTPKVYGQLVQMLAPYTRVIGASEAAATPTAAVPAEEVAEAAQALAAAAAAATEPPKRAPLRVRKAGVAQDRRSAVLSLRSARVFSRPFAAGPLSQPAGPCAASSCRRRTSPCRSSIQPGYSRAGGSPRRARAVRRHRAARSLRPGCRPADRAAWRR